MHKHPIKFLFIIMAGETIFMLPFLIPRLYRPLIIQTWGISNTDIGTAFSAYGFSAMLSYFLGGSFADKFPPRNLMLISLFATAICGSVFIASPSALTFKIIYFLFGITTTFLMWSALIRVTHDFGGENNRSTAMGILDSGRGFVAALISSILVALVGGNIENFPDKSLNIIYLTVIIFTILVGVGIWFSLKDFVSESVKNHQWSLEKSLKVLKNFDIWLLGLIILAAYSGYKSVDIYSVYLVDIQKVSLEKSSSLTSILFWVRPISALITGFSVDYFHKRHSRSRFITLIILLLLASILQFCMAQEISNDFNVIFFIIILSAALAYALRSIYFSIFGDLKIPEALIGTTVGIVSVVGFLPDFFFGTITGQLIDKNPGWTGYMYTFNFTGTILLLGCLASILLLKRQKSD